LTVVHLLFVSTKYFLYTGKTPAVVHTTKEVEVFGAGA
jgi:hypothetical protein